MMSFSKAFQANKRMLFSSKGDVTNTDDHIPVSASMDPGNLNQWWTLSLDLAQLSQCSPYHQEIPSLYNNMSEYNNPAPCLAEMAFLFLLSHTQQSLLSHVDRIGQLSFSATRQRYLMSSSTRYGGFMYLRGHTLVSQISSDRWNRKQHWILH